MEQLLHDLVSPPVSWVIVALTLFVLGWHTIGAYRGFKGEIRWLFAWSQTRQLDFLQKRRKRLQQLHDCNREYYGWLLSGVLSVLGLLAFQLVLEGLAFGPSRFGSSEKQVLVGFMVASGRFVMGLAAYVTAVNRIHDYRRLQHFNQTIATLDRLMAKLEAKQTVHPAPR
jgi:hypothetical protein